MRETIGATRLDTERSYIAGEGDTRAEQITSAYLRYAGAGRKDDEQRELEQRGIDTTKMSINERLLLMDTDFAVDFSKVDISGVTLEDRLKLDLPSPTGKPGTGRYDYLGMDPSLVDVGNLTTEELLDIPGVKRSDILGLKGIKYTGELSDTYVSRDRKIRDLKVPTELGGVSYNIFGMKGQTQQSMEAMLESGYFDESMRIERGLVDKGATAKTFVTGALGIGAYLASPIDRIFGTDVSGKLFGAVSDIVMDKTSWTWGALPLWMAGGVTR